MCCVRVPGDGPSGRRRQEVQAYSTMTRSLLVLADRLRELQVTRVVMEATSDYWKPVFYLAGGQWIRPVAGQRQRRQAPARPPEDRQARFGVAMQGRRTTDDPSQLRPTAADLGQRAVQDVAGERPDQAGVLGQRDEVVRWDQAAVGVLPADQGLGADDVPGADADLGLVVQDQLVAVQRPAQVPEQRQLRRGVAVDGHSPAKLALLGDLRRALDRNELVLHYQPKVSISTGDVIGAEALVRWQHPDRGLVPPDDFIPLAEHTGLIGPLTRYVLDSALAQVGGGGTKLGRIICRSATLHSHTESSLSVFGRPGRCLTSLALTSHGSNPLASSKIEHRLPVVRRRFHDHPRHLQLA